ncbi:MAG: biotin--[acetyl-CoA-carboxylase] ligase [Ellagibacter isourolithinifaciens]|uniref:biotin--[acetyl-CoA-carboxylase] ligase n=1 Tax=Ellagibacter isourolithinifaciens TaxID=2137581 RepID=UPI0023F035D5|nr:biotin--[acetyl-CoA-carboxylase] ligase [Ellagibacter isourolithinifaciens]MDD7689473.1 biotin--[acetyl-CoA-carboxylase] ligase [Ellagibacter isourolithinifaciens]MDY4122782.1 biotin--[acetyl-CoA-carboxylase] ligase [Ellagibacter isourolithinifaciens]MDY6111762.1 biotin--[acetyl-CoA-carboxylase] ligase [Ellagibacter isourolithinifaciens]
MFRLQVLESVDSTNEVIKRAIEDGEPEGLAIRAYRQTGGYGRQGRAWKSPRGGMYESILLRPEVEMRELPTLALVVALAVRRALASLVVDDQARRICIKWPNDVVLVGGDFGADCSTRDTALELGGHTPCSDSPALENSPLGCSRRAELRATHARQAQGLQASHANAPSIKNLYSKLAGISSEVHAGGICVGIGVNVEPPEDAMEIGGKNAPAYLADLGFGFTCEREAAINAVGDAVLHEFEPLYRRWCDGGFAALSGEFAEHSMLEGRFVRMANQLGEVVCEGTVRGVDASGRLLLRLEDGETKAVASGEVHLL